MCILIRIPFLVKFWNSFNQKIIPSKVCKYVLSFCGNQFAYCSTISNRICLKITVLYSTPYHEITMTPITYLCKQTADFKKCSIEPKYYNELTSPQTIGSTQYSLTKWFGNQVTGNRQPTKQVNGRSRSEKFSAIIIATAAIFWGRCHAMYVTYMVMLAEQCAW